MSKDVLATPPASVRAPAVPPLRWRSALAAGFVPDSYYPARLLIPFDNESAVFKPCFSTGDPRAKDLCCKKDVSNKDRTTQELAKQWSQQERQNTCFDTLFTAKECCMTGMAMLVPPGRRGRSAVTAAYPSAISNAEVVQDCEVPRWLSFKLREIHSLPQS